MVERNKLSELAGTPPPSEPREMKKEEPNFPGKGMPSGFANQFYVLVGPGSTRLVLGEQVFDESPSYSWAVTIPTTVAKDLADTILRIISEQQPIWEAAQKAATDGIKK